MKKPTRKQYPSKPWRNKKNEKSGTKIHCQGQVVLLAHCVGFFPRSDVVPGYRAQDIWAVLRKLKAMDDGHGLCGGVLESFFFLFGSLCVCVFFVLF